MLENRVERRVVFRTKKLGGIALKMVSPSMDSLPDRLVLIEGFAARFIETKRPKKNATKKQKIVHQMLRNLGYQVDVLNTIEEVNDYFDKIELLG